MSEENGNTPPLFIPDGYTRTVAIPAGFDWPAVELQYRVSTSAPAYELQEAPAGQRFDVAARILERLVLQVRVADGVSPWVKVTAAQWKKVARGLFTEVVDVVLGYKAAAEARESEKNSSSG